MHLMEIILVPFRCIEVQGRIQDSAKTGAMVNSRVKNFQPRPLIS